MFDTDSEGNLNDGTNNKLHPRVSFCFIHLLCLQPWRTGPHQHEQQKETMNNTDGSRVFDMSPTHRSRILNP